MSVQPIMTPDSRLYRQFLLAEKNYDAHDKELAEVVFCFKCGYPYFLGAQHQIIAQTDHKNL